MLESPIVFSERTRPEVEHRGLEFGQCQPVSLFVYSCWRDVGRILP